MNKKTTLNLNVFKNKGYFKSLQTLGALLLLFSVFIIGCKKDDFKGEIVGLCPVVTTDPTDKSVDIATTKLIVATFNTPMNASTINNATFSIKQGTTNIGGSVSPTSNGAVFTFKPTVDLDPYKTYTGTISKSVKDTLRTSLVADYVWTFTTLPRLTLSGSPSNGGTFTGAGDFNQGSIVTVNAIPATGYIFKNWTNSSNTIVSTNTSFQFKMDGNRTLTANFIAVPSGKFSVVLSSNPEVGGLTYGTGVYDSNSSAIISAIPSAGYRFTGWTGDVTSTANPFTITNITANKNVVANFTLSPTGTAVGPLLPNLGLAGNFSALTKSGISTTGVSTITGDIGVSPASATAITGFGLIMDTNGQTSHTPIVNGKVYAADYAAPTPAYLTTAVSNMETAFTTSNNLTVPAPVIQLGAGNLSGLTIAPGLYKFSTGVLITSPVYLNGNANDTWVFTVAQDLTANSGAKIILGPNVQAKNIYWVVSGQAILGTGVDFSGIILSKTLISLNTGAKVTGRLLAQTAVTLNASTVIQPQ